MSPTLPQKVFILYCPKEKEKHPQQTVTATEVDIVTRASKGTCPDCSAGLQYAYAPYPRATPHKK